MTLIKYEGTESVEAGSREAVRIALPGPEGSNGHAYRMGC